MILCLCKGVSDRVVKQVVASGVATVEQVVSCTGAGSKCGSCLEDIGCLIRCARAEAEKEEAIAAK
jgi:bacterioferritin-associated ferredoxin